MWGPLRRVEWALPNGPARCYRDAGHGFEVKMSNVSVKIKIIVDRWTNVDDEGAIRLSMGDFHSGSTFDGAIEVPIDEVETLLAASAEKARLRCEIVLD